MGWIWDTNIHVENGKYDELGKIYGGDAMWAETSFSSCWVYFSRNYSPSKEAKKFSAERCWRNIDSRLNYFKMSSGLCFIIVKFLSRTRPASSARLWTIFSASPHVGFAEPARHPGQRIYTDRYTLTVKSTQQHFSTSQRITCFSDLESSLPINNSLLKYFDL